MLYISRKNIILIINKIYIYKIMEKLKFDSYILTYKNWVGLKIKKAGLKIEKASSYNMCL